MAPEARRHRLYQIFGLFVHFKEQRTEKASTHGGGAGGGSLAFYCHHWSMRERQEDSGGLLQGVTRGGQTPCGLYVSNEVRLQLPRPQRLPQQRPVLTSAVWPLCSPTSSLPHVSPSIKSYT